MKKFYLCCLTSFALLAASLSAKAVGWPANYQGVMLQGFYWDSYNDTKWATLESKADEYSKYFSLIWVPNSAKAASSPGMGYDPVYWFTNHTSSFGNEAQLRSMIKTYKAKGVGIIEDVVVNHRSGRSNWYDFPSETWNGKTYHLTTGSICSTDEVWRDGGHGCPDSYKGAPDTGEDFGSSRDLDHTNATVQDHIKNYCKFLLDDLGYAGFRLDMVKGYGGQYTKIYNQYSKPQFCVGECFDGSYDVCAAWIEATGKESASFDFPLKFQLNKAFPSATSYNLTELCWTNPSGALQPAGLIHYGYPQFSVTFVDNHDTYRDHNKFNGNVLAANAFILSSPGTPCVFLRHYLDNKAAIQAMIDARNSVGLHNLSPVNVIKCESSLYVAEVTGSKGKLIVRIGTGSYTPPTGYTQKCSGSGYTIWTTAQGGVTPDKPTNPGGSYPATLHLIGNIKGKTWDTNTSYSTTGSNGVYNYSEVTIDDSGDGYGYFAFATKLGSSWDEVNGGDRYGASSGDKLIALGGSDAVTLYAAGVNSSGSQSWKITAGSYSVSVDLANMKIAIGEKGKVPDTGNGGNGGNGGGNTGSDFNVFFDNTNSNWTTPHIHHWGAAETTWPGTQMSKFKDNVWVYKVPAGTTGILFNAGDGDPTKTDDFVAQPNHIYTTSGDQGEYADAPKEDNPTPDPTPGTYPEALYMIGNVNGYAWATDKGVEAKGKNGIYEWGKVTIDDGNEGKGYFAFVTVLGSSWDGDDGGIAVNSGDRYGASAANTPLQLGGSASIVLYAAGVNASASESWEVAAGEYAVKADLVNMKVYLNNVQAGVDGVEADSDAPVLFFNLQGVRMDNPQQGIYIRVQGRKAEKVIIRN